MWKTYLALGLTTLVIIALSVQHHTLRQVKTDLAELRVQTGAPPVALQSAPRTVRIERPRQNESDLHARLAALETAVVQLTKASDYLMERGQLPLGANKKDELHRKFIDPTASERDRIQALRLLRRNGGLTDEVLQSAFDWLKTATNGNLREDLLQQMEGVTNATAKATFMELALKDPESDVREQAIENLRPYISDPAVEVQLWQALRDPDEDVREQAQEALTEGRITEARMASLRDRALDSNSTLEERVTAMQALRRANQEVPELNAALAQLASTSADAVERARAFRALDGTRDPNVILPFVQGLQDPNPQVRQIAADGLSDLKQHDPNVAQWLRYISENDPDPRVRREAFNSLRERD